MDTPPGDAVRTDAEVLARVDELIAVDDRVLPGLWLFFLDRDQRQLPVLVPIDGIPDEPEAELVGKLCWIVAGVLGETEPEGSAVITLTRSGPAVPDNGDMTWHDTLRDAAAAQGAPIRMICLATPEGTIALPAAA
jgi:hypothetical protein